MLRVLELGPESVAAEMPARATSRTEGANPVPRFSYVEVLERLAFGHVRLPRLAEFCSSSRAAAARLPPHDTTGAHGDRDVDGCAPRGLFFKAQSLLRVVARRDRPHQERGSCRGSRVGLES